MKSRGKTLYAILGVKETAPTDEIKRAYRDLAKRYHPDRTGGDKAKESRFKEISAAYDILSDPEKRQKYDAMRQGPGPGMGGIPIDFAEFMGGGRGVGDMEELFRHVFAGGVAAGRGKDGARVVFEEVFPGGGRSRRRAHESRGPAEPRREEVLLVNGVEFLRRGDDVLVDLPLSIDEAVLGARVEVPTLTGRVNLTVPAGTSSGQKLRLRGKGVDGRGDQYVVVQIVVPRHVDDRARELLREFAERTKVTPRK